MIDEPMIALALIGGIMLLAGFLLMRSSAIRHRISKQDPLRDMHKELEARSNAPESLIHEMEVRLFDYGREVEGRIETTLSVLDRLIIDADQEIGRLEDLLNTAQHSPENELVKRTIPLADADTHDVQILSSNQADRIPDLITAGLSDQEIARCLNCNLQAVVTYRHQFDSDQQTDAA